MCNKIVCVNIFLNIAYITHGLKNVMSDHYWIKISYVDLNMQITNSFTFFIIV